MHCIALVCRAGKELALAARQEEELKLKRLVEARQREKEEEARAREKIKIKLGEPSSRAHMDACRDGRGGARAACGAIPTMHWRVPHSHSRHHPSHPPLPSPSTPACRGGPA